MAMWEIDTLLTTSIELIKESKFDFESKRQIVWNLENIPEVYNEPIYSTLTIYKDGCEWFDK